MTVMQHGFFLGYTWYDCVEECDVCLFGAREYEEFDPVALAEQQQTSRGRLYNFELKTDTLYAVALWYRMVVSERKKTTRSPRRCTLGKRPEDMRCSLRFFEKHRWWGWSVEVSAPAEILYTSSLGEEQRIEDSSSIFRHFEARHEACRS